jgi:hypothetical protein
LAAFPKSKEYGNLSEKPLDRRPFYWAIGVVIVLVTCWQALEYAAEQRLHNTSLWQRWHPVVLRSAPQTATPVSVADTNRLAQAVVQTELGLYFLTGARYVPKVGDSVIVVANDDWALYLCAADGERCMTVHSFCSGAVWPIPERNAEGQVPGCHAPYLASGTQKAVAAITSPPPDRAGQQGGRQAKINLAKGMSHPQEWAHLMGLPVFSRAAPPVAKP